MAGGRIKGAVLAGGMEELKRLQEEGRISQEQLEDALDAEDLRLLDCKVDPAAWYAVAIADRVALLLFEIDGGGRIEYLHDRGRMAADRLIASGLYQQLDSLTDGKAASMSELRLLLRLVVSVQGALFDVGRWSVDTDEKNPARLKVTVEDAAAFPESMRHNVAGFFTRAGEEAGLDSGWISERPRPDLMIYRMDKDYEAPTREEAGAVP